MKQILLIAISILLFPLTSYCRSETSDAEDKPASEFIIGFDINASNKESKKNNISALLRVSASQYIEDSFTLPFWELRFGYGIDNEKAPEMFTGLLTGLRTGLFSTAGYFDSYGEIATGFAFGWGEENGLKMQWYGVMASGAYYITFKRISLRLGGEVYSNFPYSLSGSIGISYSFPSN